jgi:glycerol-3-phosphate cytidylyltransferase-like family protein
MDEKARQRLIYVETCRYVDRVQEGLNEIMSVDAWSKLIARIEIEMRSAMHAPSAAVEQK